MPVGMTKQTTVLLPALLAFSWADLTKANVMQMQVVEVFNLMNVYKKGRHHILDCVLIHYIRNRNGACRCFLFWVLNESMS